MTDPEREHLAQRIRDLEGRLRRWRVVSLALLALLLVHVIAGGLAGVAWQRQRQAEWERERAEAARSETFQANVRAIEQEGEERERRARAEGEAKLEAARAEMRAWRAVREETDRARAALEKGLAEQTMPTTAKGAGTPRTGPATRAAGPAERQKRLKRWTWKFDGVDGDQYLRQLRDLKPGGGASLAIPVGDDRFEVIRDLGKQPAVGKVEDLATLKTLFFIEDVPDRVAGLAQGLGIKKPPYVIVLFPRELEEEVAHLESRKAGNMKVDDIEETLIEVVRSPDGYRLVVVSIKGTIR
jgi:hypothetical protein